MLCKLLFIGTFIYQVVYESIENNALVTYTLRYVHDLE